LLLRQFFGSEREFDAVRDRHESHHAAVREAQAHGHVSEPQRETRRRAAWGLSLDLPPRCPLFGTQRPLFRLLRRQ
jgi:hypothetical protein